MIQALDGKSGIDTEILEGNIRNQEVEEEKSILTRKDFPELEFVTSEEIAVANKIREEIKFFKAAALRYLHEEKYLLIDKVERIVNDPDYRKKNPLLPELNWDYAAIRLLHLIQTKEFFIRDENGIKQVKLADLQEDMARLEIDFPELVRDLKKASIDVDQFTDEDNENEVKLNNAVTKTLNLSRFEGIIVNFSVWLSKRIGIKNLDIEERMASDIIKLIENKKKIKIKIDDEKAKIGQPMALRCMKIVDNIQIDYTKNRYK